MKAETRLTKTLSGPNARGPIDPNSPKQQELVASIKVHGILIPLLVMASGVLLDGFRRLAAAIALGMESVPVIVTDRLLTDTEIRLVQLTTAIHRADLTGYEKWQAIEAIRRDNPEFDQQKLAELLGQSPASVTKLLSPSKCIPSIQAALKAGQVTVSDCYEASQLSPELQAKYLAMKLAGASREERAKAIRKPRTTLTVKLSRVKLPLQDGATVVVSGAGEMDMDQLIETLEAAISAARKANKDSLDIKTLSKVMEDKAKKKGA